MITVQTPPRPEITPAALRLHAKTLLSEEVGFVSNRDFSELGDPVNWDMSKVRAWRTVFQGVSKSKVAEETEISRLCETGLLSADQEVVLFRTMNQLKYGVNVLRSRLNPKRPAVKIMDLIAEFLQEAEAIRNHIVSANVRLVIAIVKRLTGPQHHFDEFVSDGTLSLMQVVEKFDFDRGFRFSTYAYRAITRTVYRKMANLHKQESRVMTTSDDMLMEVPNRQELSLSEQTWANLRGLLGQFLDKLDSREQLIIHARYALGNTNKSQTFQSLADSLGVSKERVRQLERRAVKKLQSLASKVDLDCFVEAAIA
jgi:RNA polymerase sigma factor (sigma-70 family)